MAKQSKRVTPKDFISKTGVIIIDAYCRRCRETKHPRDFYQGVDKLLDTNGIMSICKNCCIELYDEAYLSERTMNRAFLKVCRILNIVYDESVIESVTAQITKAKEDERTARHPFAIYRIRIAAMLARGSEMESEAEHDLTFHEPDIIARTEEDDALTSSDDFWGNEYTPEEVEFLELQYREFKRNYTIEDDYATVVLLKLACTKLLEMREKTSSSLEKQLMNIFKELAISPQHQKAATGGKIKDTFGVWIKEIEQYTPAEWLASLGDKRDLHHDVDSVDLYYKNFVERPIRNFVTSNPDYNILDEDGNSEDWGI